MFSKKYTAAMRDRQLNFLKFFNQILPSFRFLMYITIYAESSVVDAILGYFTAGYKYTTIIRLQAVYHGTAMEFVSL